MSRSAPSRPTFPFLGAALLLAVAAAVCAAALVDYRPAVFLAALALACSHLAIPSLEPIRVHARGSRRER